MWDEFMGAKVVLDLQSPYVCLGTLLAVHEQFLELKQADFHDLRDTQTTRENYVVAAVHSGIKKNRKRVLVARHEIVAISRLDDIIDR